MIKQIVKLIAAVILGSITLLFLPFLALYILFIFFTVRLVFSFLGKRQSLWLYKPRRSIFIPLILIGNI